MKTIIANWKMNPVKLSDAQKLVADLNKVRTKNKVIICAPFVYLPLLKTKFDLGAQDIYWQEHGPYTGEISAAMLRQFKVKYVLIGHSERRNLGETDHEINLKVKAALANKIIPILCVGHGLAYGEPEGEVLMHLQRQIQLDLTDIDPSKVIIAYEPVWAISSGSGHAPHVETPEHAERVAMFIRIKFKTKKVLYGGSSDIDNYKAFLDRDIDGLLVGGASLRKDEFKQMIQY